MSDDKRVIPRYLDLGSRARIRDIFRRVKRIKPQRVRELLRDLRKNYAGRHRDLDEAFLRHYAIAARNVRGAGDLDDQQKLLLGAYFTMEYSIEAAALFNPSIVPHPDQSGLEPGSVRVLMSLRATGEGHISSIVFRRAILSRSGIITFAPPPRYAYAARLERDRDIHKSVFERRLRDRHLYGEDVAVVLNQLGDSFTLSQLEAALNRAAVSPELTAGVRRLSSQLIWMALANYELDYPQDCHPEEIVLFPATRYESRGMEDTRLVRFVEEDGAIRYYGTYTAYDGQRIYPMLLETADFHTFHIATLWGRYSRNKGMALFPRKVDGSYMMLSRHDGENNYVLISHNPYVWNAATKLQSPREPWELVQLGNCGSPLETEAGWLVITHGVGPMRRYCLGAILLDLHDPARVIGRLRRPFLVPTARERAGYVPNVVYTCGCMIHEGHLTVPYAMADSRVSFVSLVVPTLLQRLLDAGP
ncbi:MAG: glycosidase [Planctomycetes bacterium]|nr:glycosidase [Planctomycetota bacterium]